MIYDLEEKDFDKVKPIFQEQSNHPVINAIINRNNPGKIYVDDVHQPKTTLVWAKNEIFFLAGDANNNEFNHSLEAFICETITPEALEIGEDVFNLEVLPLQQWRSKVEGDEIFKTKLVKTGYRVPFIFNPTEYQALGEWKETIPSSYSIRRIDKYLLSQDRENVAMDEVSKFWRSVDEFMEKGVGYCSMKGDQVISTCISVFISKNEYEIGINTYDREHRGKGLATLTVRAFIDYCLLNGVTPHWTTETFRLDSIAIAEKLGFKKLQEYPSYYFSFRD
jgi:RimJ/RimL family protein N-acetyltransferase